VRALYGYAIERGHVEFNPADGLVMPRADALWGEPPTWEDRPLRERPEPDRPAPDRPPRERPEPDRPVPDRPAPDRPAPDRPARDRHEPIAHLPDRMLSFAIKWVFVLLVVVALVSVLDSL